MIKRPFDILLSASGLLIGIPLFLILAILVKIDSTGPIFFLQERMGMDFRPFRIFKFRTMSVHDGKESGLLTVAGDKRITRVGEFLRKYKLDELPQLINIVKGEMSFVGPRPEVPRYVRLFESDYEILLTVRPGMTGPASIEYSDEETLLAAAKDWE